MFTTIFVEGTEALFFPESILVEGFFPHRFVSRRNKKWGSGLHNVTQTLQAVWEDIN